MRTLLILALAGVAVTGCKKKETETAAVEPAPAPMDPAKTIVVNINGDHSYKNVMAICKAQGSPFKAPVQAKAATITGLVGDCTLKFMPGDVTYGPVQGGSTVNCIAQADGTVACKPG